jgi:hypothetical protein
LFACAFRVPALTKRDLDELRIGGSEQERRGAPLLEPSGRLPRTIRGSLLSLLHALRWLAPMFAAIALALVTLGQPDDLDYDLQLIAPPAAPAGELLPLRALLYTNLRGVEGPRLSARAVRLERRDRRKRVLASTQLVPSRAGQSDMEGSLAIPAGSTVRLWLAARVQIEDVPLSLETPIAIGQLPGMVAEGRPLRALQQFSAGPIGAEPQQIAPDRLEVRVAGGACVPEEQCLLFVHVGTPAAAVWVEANSTVTPAASAARPGSETSAVATLSVVTHGPEAQLWLRASRAGELVARRSVRLPVALGAGRLIAERVLSRAPALPRVALLGGEGGCILDAFRDEAWVRTGSASRCTHPIALPFAPLTAGTYRLQARRDPFSSSSAGVAVVHVLAAGEVASDALHSLARAASTLEPSDRFAQSCLAGEVEPDDASLGYLAALLESGLIAQPHARSGYSSSLQRLARSQARLRGLSIAALVLGCVSLVLAVGRSGLLASARAEQILNDAGQLAALSRRARMRGAFTVALSVLSLVLVFVVLGAYVLARTAP